MTTAQREDPTPPMLHAPVGFFLRELFRLSFRVKRSPSLPVSDAPPLPGRTVVCVGMDARCRAKSEREIVGYLMDRASAIEERLRGARTASEWLSRDPVPQYEWECYQVDRWVRTPRYDDMLAGIWNERYRWILPPKHCAAFQNPSSDILAMPLRTWPE